jgi:hypothetical protein
MKIFCVVEQKDVEAERVTGREIYPHRPGLAAKVFYRCPHCGNYVGTHKDGRPLGCIPTPELRAGRQAIHAIIDPLWRARLISRSEIYARFSHRLGREYHTGEIRSPAEAEIIRVLAQDIKSELLSSKKIREVGND